jgi:hypothetical protein
MVYHNLFKEWSFKRISNLHWYMCTCVYLFNVDFYIASHRILNFPMRYLLNLLNFFKYIIRNYSFEFLSQNRISYEYCKFIIFIYMPYYNIFFFLIKTLLNKKKKILLFRYLILFVLCCLFCLLQNLSL